MSKVSRVSNGDYKIIIQDGGTITLDTTDGLSNGNGRVVIKGSLEVEGTRTYVESTDMRIEDNIIILTKDNTAAGIPASLDYRSGIEVERGSSANARFVYDEQIAWTLGGSSGNGTWTFEQGSTTVPIRTSGIVPGGTLYINTGSGVISVTGSTNYEESVLNYTGGVVTDPGGGVIIDDDAIPNTKALVDYVDYQLGSSFQARIEENDTFVETVDDPAESYVDFGVDGSAVAKFYVNRAELYDLKIQDSTITSLNSNSDLVLEGSGTGSVQIKDNLLITETPGDDDALVDPTAPAEGVKLYSKTQSTGNTGLYFVNKSNNRDEIVSKNRSLLYSMLF